MGILKRSERQTERGEFMSSREVRIYERCPFCEELNVDAAHLVACSLRNAQIIQAKHGKPGLDVVELVTAIQKMKTLRNTYETASQERKELMWCCQKCFVFGEGKLPDVCPKCNSFCTSPVSLFFAENGAS